MIRTKLTDMFELQHPLILAPMGGVAGGALAAAVSNAGGLGLVGGGYGDREWLRTELSVVKAGTKRPWGVGLITWSIEPDLLDLALSYRPDAFILSFGDPRPHVPAIRKAGCRLICQVQDLAQAKLAAAAGADLIVAEGNEAGGHSGTRGTLPFVPAAVDAVAPLPVVAAGGIADGRGLAAALALGAQGALLGTRFVMSDEAGALPAYLARLRDGRETDTVYSQLFDGGWPDSPHRTLRNGLIDAWEAAGRPGPGARAGEGEVVGRTAAGDPISRYQSVSPAEGFEGDVDELPMWAGQSVGALHE